MNNLTYVTIEFQSEAHAEEYFKRQRKPPKCAIALYHGQPIITSLEEKLKATEERLREAEEVIWFYGNGLNWDYNSIADNMTSVTSEDWSIPDCACEDRGGKLARQYLSKYKETNKEEF